MSELSIIVVDDDPVIARLIEMRLKKMGYIVSAVTSDGADAIRLAEGMRPDLVIMDIRIPGELDGIDSAAQIIESLGIPVVFLTGDTDIQTFQRAKLTGDCEYLVKPFSDSDLYIAIELSIHKHALFTRMRMQQASLTRILNSISDVVIASNHEGSILYANHAAVALTGRSNAELMKTNISAVIAIIHRTGGRPVENLLKHLMQTGEGPGTLEDAELITRDGKRLPVEGEVVPQKDEGGKVTGFVLVLHPNQRGRQSPDH